MSRTDAVAAAMARWHEPDVRPPMAGLGVAVDPHGAVVIARRWGDSWFDVLDYPPHACRDGAAVAGHVVACIRDEAPAHLDVSAGRGAHALGHLLDLGLQAVGVDLRGGPDPDDFGRTGRFANRRAQLLAALLADPALALPPDDRIASDGSQLDAVLLAAAQTPKRDDVVDLARGDDRNEFDPFKSPERFY